MKVNITVNGVAKESDVEPRTLLVHYIRETIGLTGTNIGCDTSSCGACTVHVDGQAMRSCVTPVSAVAGRKVVTIEAMENQRVGRAVQEAWKKLDVVQCGYCQSGQIMSAVALLSRNRKPTDADIDSAMSGNACRCATYVRIRAAIKRAAAALA